MDTFKLTVEQSGARLTDRITVSSNGCDGARLEIARERAEGDPQSLYLWLSPTSARRLVTALQLALCEAPRDVVAAHRDTRRGSTAGVPVMGEE